MKKQSKSFWLRYLKISGITFLGILFLMFILPILFPEAITNKVKAFANEKLKGELFFKDSNLSFFSHFPSLTLTLDDFLLKGSIPFEKDTLVAAKEIAFGINVKSIFFGDKIKIDKIYLSDGFINVKVNKKGQPNYNVYVSESSETASDTSSASIQLERIDIKKVKLIYDDKSTNILIKAKELNYLGKGDLNASVFDLKTKAQIQGFDFTFDNEDYLKNKTVNAELVTKINTNSLSLLFQENNLKINKLPVDFKGKFDFLKNGYDLDFTVKSENSQLNYFFTALPPQFVKWLSKTSVKGKADLLFTLKGKYIAEENRKPNIHFNMKIREGYIAYNKSPIAADNIFLNFDTRLPSLDTEQLELKIDSIYFDVGKDFFNGNVKWKGMANPNIDARIRSKLDLAKLDQAIGIENMTLKGMFSADIVSKGKYIKVKNQFPVTKGDLELKNGFIQSTYYPNPITDINCKAKAINETGKLKDLFIQLNPATFSFENKLFALVASFKDFEDINYDIKANGELDIERIYKVFSQKGLNVTGYAKMDLALKGKQSDATNGRYVNLQNSGSLALKKIKINSEFLPLPFVIEEGDFSFYQDKMNFTNFMATYGKSDFKMNGYMENVINFALSENQVLKGNFKVESDFIQVNEFLTISAEKDVEEQSVSEFGVVVIPSQFNFNLNANAKKINFDELNIENLAGKVNVNQGKLALQNTVFSLIGTRVTMDAVYFHETPTRANFDYKMKATDFDVKRAYNEISLFREMASAAEYAEGIVSLDYKIAGKLDGNMTPVFPSLFGGGTLSVKNVKMKGFKLFNTISQKTETEALKDPDISKINIKTTVKNNIIKIERFKFKVSGFRPRIEGETSFDGKVNLKMRIGLPPLGIIGIPIKVTGTQDNPIIGLGKKTEDLEETEYEEGMENLPKTPEVIPTSELPVVTPKDSIKN